MDSKGRALHAQAAQLREEGQHLEALKFHDEAMLAYQKDGDLLGMAEVLADRSIVLRHLFEEGEDKSWLLLAKAEMEASVNIAKSSSDKTALAIPLYNLAKVNEELGDFQRSVEIYKEVLGNMENNPPPTHDRSAILADMKIHLNYAEYKVGDKSSLDRMLDNIKALENSDEKEISRYNYDVWVSGAYMSLAQMLKEDNPEEARGYLQKAKEIIDSNPDLTLRKKQLEKLSQEFK